MLLRACWRSLARPDDLFFVGADRTSHQGVVNLILDPKDRRKVSNPNFIYATEIEILRANQNIICPTEIRSNYLRESGYNQKNHAILLTHRNHSRRYHRR